MYLDQNILPPNKEDLSLFYPCCGDDLEISISLFIDIISDFWFVDIREIRTNVAKWFDVYQLGCKSFRTLRGTTIKRKKAYEIQVNTYQFIRLEDCRFFRIHLCKGRGYDAFRTLFDDEDNKLAVFFYRGDSQGEGGSGFYWLRRNRLADVLRRLMHGGLIITDGSNAIDQLAEFHRDNDIGEQAVGQASSFDFKGYGFKCIGYAGERYGPTLIWKVMECKDA